MTDEEADARILRTMWEQERTTPKGWFRALDIAERAYLGSGGLYPAMARLERDGLVESGWEKPAAPPPRRRIYWLSEEGRRRGAAIAPFPPHHTNSAKLACGGAAVLIVGFALGLLDESLYYVAPVVAIIVLVTVLLCLAYERERRL